MIFHASFRGPQADDYVIRFARRGGIEHPAVVIDLILVREKPEHQDRPLRFGLVA